MEDLANCHHYSSGLCSQLLLGLPACPVRTSLFPLIILVIMTVFGSENFDFSLVGKLSDLIFPAQIYLKPYPSYSQVFIPIFSAYKEQHMLIYSLAYLIFLFFYLEYPHFLAYSFSMCNIESVQWKLQSRRNVSFSLWHFPHSWWIHYCQHVKFLWYMVFTTTSYIVQDFEMLMPFSDFLIFFQNFSVWLYYARHKVDSPKTKSRMTPLRQRKRSKLSTINPW